MSASRSVWYRLGYTLEKTRRSPVQKRLASLAERQEAATQEGDGVLSQVFEALVGGSRDTPKGTGGDAAGAVDGRDLAPLLGTVGIAALSRVVARRPLSLGGMVRAALVGAGAETARLVVRRLRSGRTDPDELADDLVRGAANGLVYGTLLGPIAPGAALSKGLIYGAGSFLASGEGGVPELLGSLSPHRRIPGLSGLVRPVVNQEDVVDHLIFGIVLAILYESSNASSGT